MKLKNIILNVITVGSLGWTFYTSFYLAAPVEVQAVLPDIDTLTAAITGGSSGLLGGGILMLRNYLAKQNLKVDNNYGLIAENQFLQQRKYEEFNSNLITLSNNYVELKKVVERNNVLQEANLKAKLSNPYIEETIKAELGSVLNDKES